MPAICDDSPDLLFIATVINTIIITISICIGVSISYDTIIKSYTIFNIGLGFPISILLSYYFALKVNLITLAKFWIPKFVLAWSLIIIVFTEYYNPFLIIAISLLYYTNIIIYNKSELIFFVKKVFSKLL